ncbi:MAG: heavy metal translocating P-type ATPase, partial [Fimbriimonadaceae bacterium]|nr:heavy metal translocating P-type ATPase [Alphaproteobacteria bacterium]
MDLIVPDIHCAGCIARIERALNEVPGVTRARVNLGSKRLAVEWETGKANSDTLAQRVRGLGYSVQPFDSGQLANDASEAQGKILLRAIAVAGFAAGNIMLLSVSVWSGAEAATKDLFHWISALIAIPAVAYAGRPFFFSALRALQARSLNMDVPISLAVLLATGMSVVETFLHGPNAYFDAAVTLLLFLLVGRYLDHMTRSRAHSVAGNLLALNATGATIVDDDGSYRMVALENVKPGMNIAVAAGEKVPADGTILSGMSDFDLSLVTGESIPATLETGAQVHAGTINITGPVIIRVMAVGEDTLLSEIVRLMEDAEQGRAKYMRIADRAARIYAPAVHLVALLTFLGWLVWSGGDWHAALLAAIAVLIITCPCALGLAVPAVQVVANSRLLKNGILVKDGTGLERLGEIDS